MSVYWEELDHVLSPIRDYEDLCSRFQKSYSYSIIRDNFNFSLQDLAGHTHILLGGDIGNRYEAYEAKLIEIISDLKQKGVQDILDLVERVNSREKLELFCEQSGISPYNLAELLKYLVYWFFPGHKYLSSLIRQEDAPLLDAAKKLRSAGVRSNLDLLQLASSAPGRKSLAETTGLPLEAITDLVNRADFSRLPWASKATISNIIGAGYISMERLANADPEKLFADFFHYGDSIGKNLKLGNEIQNSYRIAKIVPVLVED